MYVEIGSNFIDIISDFLRGIQLFGGGFHGWYVGLTRDSKHSFLNIHQVDLLEKHWIMSNKSSDLYIQYVRKLLVSLGCQNNKSLDMENSNRVYLYQTGADTKEVWKKSRIMFIVWAIIKRYNLIKLKKLYRNDLLWIHCQFLKESGFFSYFTQVV